MVSIDVKCAVTGDVEKIRISTTELLLRADGDNLAKSENLRDWKSRNTVLVLPFLTEAVVINRETATEALLKIFAEKIHDHGIENNTEDTYADEDRQYKEDNEK